MYANPDFYPEPDPPRLLTMIIGVVVGLIIAGVAFCIFIVRNF